MPQNGKRLRGGQQLAQNQKGAGRTAVVAPTARSGDREGSEILGTMKTCISHGRRATKTGTHRPGICGPSKSGLPMGSNAHGNGTKPIHIVGTKPMRVATKRAQGLDLRRAWLGSAKESRPSGESSQGRKPPVLSPTANPAAPVPEAAPAATPVTPAIPAPATATPVTPVIPAPRVGGITCLRVAPHRGRSGSKRGTIRR